MSTTPPYVEFLNDLGTPIPPPEKGIGFEAVFEYAKREEQKKVDKVLEYFANTRNVSKRDKAKMAKYINIEIGNMAPMAIHFEEKVLKEHGLSKAILAECLRYYVMTNEKLLEGLVNQRYVGMQS